MVAGLAALVTLTPAVAAEPVQSFLTHDGHSWRALAEVEKLALLTGFLIGAAFEQAMALAPDAAGPPAQALEALRREGKLRFPFAPAVYKARLEDFYFYQDRRPVPVYEALFFVNEQIHRAAAPGR